jgi:hypothetical protein
MDNLLVATIMGFLILLASMVSVELGLSVAIIEIAFGVAAGNFPRCHDDTVGRLHRVVRVDRPDLLAGAEVDPG